MNNFLFVKEEEVKIFKSYVDSANDALKEAAKSHNEAQYSFLECVSFFENLMEPINELLSKYNYLHTFGENVHSMLIDMQVYQKEQLGYIFQSKSIYEMLKNSKTKNKEQDKYKEVLLSKFIDNGVLLSKENKKSLQNIDKDLFILEKKFYSNIIEDRKKWKFLISESEKDSLNENVAKLFTYVDEDLYSMPYSFSACQEIFMFCESEEIRKKLNESLNKLAGEGEHNNEPIVYQIVELCYKKAQIQGFKSPSEKIMKDSLGGSPEEVLLFLNSFNKKIKPLVKSEYLNVSQHYKNQTGHNLKPHSFQYAIEKYKESEFNSNKFKYQTNDESEYFKTVKESLPILFDFFKEIYGFDIEFLDKNENKDVFGLNKDEEFKNKNNLDFLTISENGVFKGCIILDLYEREGKKLGAWANNIIPLRNEDQNGKLNLNDNNVFKRAKNKVALFGVSANFSKEKGLTFPNLKILLHEFGHCLHYASSKVDFAELAGTNTMVRDAVEIPSMLLEKFYNDENLISKLSEGRMPKQIINIIKKQSSFMIGDFYNRRLIAPAIFDLKLFSDQQYFEDMKNNKTLVKDFVKLYNENTVFGTSEDNNLPLIFTHLFSGNYKSGYYGYFLADIYAVDAFEKIKENFKNGEKFKEEFMSYGSSLPAKELYFNFNPDGVSFERLFNFYGINKKTPKNEEKTKLKL